MLNAVLDEDQSLSREPTIPIDEQHVAA